MALPKLDNLTGSVVRVPGQAVLIDPEVLVITGDYPFTSLHVSLTTVRTGEVLGVKAEGTNVVLEPDLSVGARILIKTGSGNVDIGTIDTLDADYIVFSFNEYATAPLIQQLVRALTYKDTSGETGFTVASEIGFYLEDTHGSSDAIVYVGDKILGTASQDIFEVDQSRLSIGDSIDGGAGDNDVLQLTGGGEFYLSFLSKLDGVETIRGSAGNDIIIIDGSQLADVNRIEGGGAPMGDVLAFTGKAIDLTGVSISDFKRIELRTDGAVVTVKDAVLAKLMTGYSAASDTLRLEGGSLTEAERLALHRRGIDTIIAKNEAGVEVTTTHTAPRLTGLDDGIVHAPVGSPVFLDNGRDALLNVDSGILGFLYVYVGNPVAGERITIDPSSGITFLAESEINVNGVKIGNVSGLGTASVSFDFNDAATTERVQQLIRALIYTNTGSANSSQRHVLLHLKDVAQRETNVDLTIDPQPNEAPTNLTLDNTSIREHAADSTKIGDLSATDAPGSNLTYQILRKDGTWGSTDGRFKIEGNQLKVANGVLLDYEQATSHTITIKVSDEGGLSREETFTISLEDVNPEYITGSSDNDTLMAGSGKDILNGGAGADRMEGGAGDDVYHVDDAGDVIIDISGNDSVLTRVDYVAHASIETIIAGGTGAIRITGNAGENGIEGNGSANILDGAGGDDRLYGDAGDDVLIGGEGSDALQGGSGNDIYYIDAADQVSDIAGVDTVVVAFSYMLANNLENLTGAGTGAISLSGNGLANTITGNIGRNTIKAGSGNDTLKGGKGNDVLYGGAGSDKFVFNTAPSKTTNKDLIKDWSAKYDTIQLENAVFKALKKTGTLSKSYFVLGSKAKDGNDYVGYNKTTGDLWYDPNGSKVGGQVAYANIGKSKAVDYKDFVVI
jgi:Ca2+-binding RTX toxin-like protein